MYPYFSPVLAQIGPFQLRWYGLMYALAFTIGYWYLHCSRHGKALVLNKAQKDTLAIAVIAGLLIGGRIGYIILYNLAYYLANPLKIFAVWEGGMSFHGGLIGVILAIYLFVRKNQKHFLEITDVIASIAPIGLFFGRIGNFINGELYGRIASQNSFLSGICFYFPDDPQNCRYPSQILEAFLEGLALFIILYFVRFKKQREGLVSALFLIFYGIFRIFAEEFREPDSQIGFLFNWFTEGQILSALMMASGLIIFFIVRFGRHTVRQR